MRSVEGNYFTHVAFCGHHHDHCCLRLGSHRSIRYTVCDIRYLLFAIRYTLYRHGGSHKGPFTLGDFFAATFRCDFSLWIDTVICLCTCSHWEREFANSPTSGRANLFFRFAERNFGATKIFWPITNRELWMGVVSGLDNRCHMSSSLSRCFYLV